jgi:NADH-quinone oxidoreductase subunit E
MKRYDLRPLKDDFYSRMLELMDKDIKDGENAIFLFEIGDFSHIQKSADIIYEAGYTLMNSLKFNEVDWTIVVKKVKPEIKPFEEEQKKEEDEEDDDDE